MLCCSSSEDEAFYSADEASGDGFANNLKDEAYSPLPLSKSLETILNRCEYSFSSSFS